MGKSMIIYVVGVSAIVGYALLTMGRTSASSMDTYAEYYSRTMAHNLAIAGANIGTQRCLNDTSYNTNTLNTAFAGGSFDVYVIKSGDTTRIRSISHLPIHFYSFRQSRWINEARDTVEAVIKIVSFSKYSWFTDQEKNGYVGSPFRGGDDWKITGDSVWGLAHTNGRFNLGGRPYFHDKVTATNSPQLMTVGGVRAPIYNGGYQWGVTVPRSAANLTNLLTTASGSGGLLNNTGNDVALTFINDGRVAVKIPPTTGSIRNDTANITSLAPSGVVAVSGGDIRIKGTYRGRITVVALKGSNANKGNVWLDGNGIAAFDNPRSNSASTDMMGIVAERNAFITRDNSRSEQSVFNIQAAVYCHEGELTAQDFWNIGKHGRVSLFGGVTQKTAGSLGTFGGSGKLTGMDYSIRHDPRFLTAAPPGYPKATKYELVSWYEK
ncbi:MAG: hypothetical protein HY961_02275 [Ignavibacteriae bacterium]|nr:hypothetical protein [Ignavibacteriota bacterium]